MLAVVSGHALPVVVPSLHMCANSIHNSLEGRKKSRKKKEANCKWKELGGAVRCVWTCFAQSRVTCRPYMSADPICLQVTHNTIHRQKRTERGHLVLSCLYALADRQASMHTIQHSDRQFRQSTKHFNKFSPAGTGEYCLHAYAC